MDCYGDLNDAMEQCDRMSLHVQRLRRAVMYNNGSVASEKATKRGAPATSMNALPPLSDAMFSIAADMEALLSQMKAKIGTDLRGSVTNLSNDVVRALHSSAALGASRNDPDRHNITAESPALAEEPADYSSMMRVFAAVDEEHHSKGEPHGKHHRHRQDPSAASVTSQRRRQLWIHENTSLSRDDTSLGQRTAASMLYQPTASAIVMKQVDRWKQHLAESSIADDIPELSVIQSPHNRAESARIHVTHEDVVDAPFELLPTASVEGSPRTRPPSGGSSKRVMTLTPSAVHGSALAGSTTSTALPANRPSSGSQLSRRSSQRRPTSASGRSVDALVNAGSFSPFPYAWTPFPNETSVATWWHRVVHALQCGQGTTVLTLDGASIGQDTANVMLSEVSTEPPCLSSLVSTVMSMRPESTTLYLVDRTPKGSDEASWRMYAVAGQTERVARGSPILASRKSKAARQLLTEKLQFAADRPVEPGLLETMFADTCRADIGKNLWVRGDYRTITSLAKDALIRSGAAEAWAVMPPPRGHPVAYFATSGSNTASMTTLPAAMLGQSQAAYDETPRGSATPPQSGPQPPRSPSPFDGMSGAASVVHHDALDDSEFVVVDCFPHILCPVSYALCSVHPFHAGECPRSWVFEGSADHGTTWVTLRHHVNDVSIGNGCDFAIFDVPPVVSSRPAPFASTSTFPSMEIKSEGSMRAVDAATTDVVSRFCGSMFRVRLTGPNAAGTMSLQVGALELYGRALVRGQVRSLTDDDAQSEHNDATDEDITPAAVFGCVSPTQPLFLNELTRRGPIPPTGPLPPPPAAAKGKKGAAKKK